MVKKQACDDDRGIQNELIDVFSCLMSNEDLKEQPQGDDMVASEPNQIHFLTKHFNGDPRLKN